MHRFAAMGGDGFTAFEECQEDLIHHTPKNNLVLINELIHMDENLLAGYADKYPNRISVREEEDGRKVMELDLPKPKNVKMIGMPNPDHH